MKNQSLTRMAGPRFSLAVGATALLLSLGATAYAQAKDDTTKPDDATKAAQPARPPGEQPNLIPNLGAGEIDPNQPLKADYLISVSVVGEPEPSGEYLVDPSGNVGIRYGGITNTVSVKGLTPVQASQAIAKLLKTYVKDPQVTVSIKATPRPYVYVRGAARVTGPVLIANDTTLADVLGKVDTLPDADLTHIYVKHKEQDKGISYNYKKYLRPTGEGPDEKQNPRLMPGDAITVTYLDGPNASGGGSGDSKATISVLGEVVRGQSNVPVRGEGQLPVTLKEAISLVGGLSPAANRHIVSVRHAGSDRAVVYDLEKADSDPNQNPELQPNDSVFVEKLKTNDYINVNGGFVRPQKYPYEGPITLTQIAEDAGGIAPYAKEKSGRIFRHPDNDAAHTKIIVFDWTKIRDGKAPDVDLRPGDSVTLTPGGPSTAPNFLGVISALGSLGFFFNGIRDFSR